MYHVIPTARWHENLRFLLGHFLPYYLSGIFIRCRFFGWLFARLRIHPFCPRFFARLRKRHGSDRILVRLLGRPVLLLFEQEDVKQVLEYSPRVYAEPRNKRRGMGFFQPDAVTISRGTAWEKRRAFNEQALDAASPLHAMAGPMLQRIQAVIPERPLRDWTDFSGTFGDIALSVVFGRVDPEGKAALDALIGLMGKANRLFWLKPSAEQAALEALIRTRLFESPEGSLVAMAPKGPLDPQVQPARQVPHWLFALADTLPMNVMRALLLILSFPDVERRVRAELDASGTATPESIAGLRLLDGCLQEAMRLWPTTPVLAREMIRRDSLSGAEVPPGTQVMILNNVLHRDEAIVQTANRFWPERWAEGVPPFVYNHMSNGTQGCAGRHLALFVGKAVLAELVQRWTYSDPRPAIDPDRPVPLINNHFEIRFQAAPRGS